MIFGLEVFRRDYCWSVRNLALIIRNPSLADRRQSEDWTDATPEGEFYRCGTKLSVSRCKGSAITECQGWHDQRARKRNH